MTWCFHAIKSRTSDHLHADAICSYPQECIPVWCSRGGMGYTRRPQQKATFNQKAKKATFNQKAIMKGHFQPEGQYQKVTFPKHHPLPKADPFLSWRHAPQKEQGTRQPDRKWHQTPLVNRQRPVKTLPCHNFICSGKNRTRWYPWGIQWLVSTYSNCNPVCSRQNSESQDLPKFQFGGMFCSS